MKLYDSGRAPNPRRVRVFLAEKGIDLALEQVDIGKLEQKSDAFTAINPYQRVPVLELDDGTLISETVAICRYIEETHPEPPLMGINAIDKAMVEMWQRRMELTLLLPVAFVFRHLHPAMKEMEVPQVAEWGEANRPRAIEQMRFLDAELANRAYIAGERFTIADITAMIALDFCKPSRIEIPDDLPNLSRWYEAVKARPSAQA
ncbi:glutathione S-transferase [Breoghania corrubedonensis]|uniref:Glutathione S-transferase n=1 Tax=Breoghania corrubedonensis TaxID=665038 RepID=A0A2T5V1E2_9HYPH|nr:glutathione S-transferase [Breoghania corrubedonensis]PTW57562.1 glutathione S-transferase [Breoghania corrubedonensis]